MQDFQVLSIQNMNTYTLLHFHYIQNVIYSEYIGENPIGENYLQSVLIIAGVTISHAHRIFLIKFGFVSQKLTKIFHPYRYDLLTQMKKKYNPDRNRDYSQVAFSAWVPLE